MVFFEKLVRRVNSFLSRYLEIYFRVLEREEYSRGGVLTLIPKFSDRQGGLGTTAYGEWCYILGVFQSIIFLHFPKERPIQMRDVGCGVGRMYLAARTHLTDSDQCTGIDGNRRVIEICKRQYTQYTRSNFSFLHFDTSNSVYSDKKFEPLKYWPLADGRHNLITALSIWTHLREKDWIFYLYEVKRALTQDGLIIINFFVLDARYNEICLQKSERISRLYPQKENRWIFDQRAYGSEEWLCPDWACDPESAIGVRKSAFDREVLNAGLVISKYYSGSWKDRPGLFSGYCSFLKIRYDPTGLTKRRSFLDQHR